MTEKNTHNLVRGMICVKSVNLTGSRAQQALARTSWKMLVRRFKLTAVGYNSHSHSKQQPKMGVMSRVKMQLTTEVTHSLESRGQVL